jgi:hypothetical protein
MRSLPDRHFVTNPRKKHAFIGRHLGFGQVWACLLELSFQVIYSSLGMTLHNPRTGILRERDWFCYSLYKSEVSPYWSCSVTWNIASDVKIQFCRSLRSGYLLRPENCSRSYCIEIIDIECVLLSFLSKKIVSTKWRIEKGILVGPRLLRRGISRGCRECELFFQLKSLQNIYIGT